MDKEYYSIGEVSKICNVNIRTLHYYNDIKLLVPQRINEDNGYRYYTKKQILEMMIIKEYKFMGFSLKEIRILLNRDDINLSKKMLEMKCDEIDKKVSSLTFLKKRFKGYIHAVEQSFNQTRSDDNFFIKEVKGCFAAYLDYQGAFDTDVFDDKFIELLRKIEISNLEVAGDRYIIFGSNFDSLNFDDIKIRFFIPVKSTFEIKDFVCKMPKLKVILKTHFGAHEEIWETYQKMTQFAKDNQFSVKNVVVIRMIIDVLTSINEEEHVTETMLIINE